LFFDLVLASVENCCGNLGRRDGLAERQLVTFASQQITITGFTATLAAWWQRHVFVCVCEHFTHSLTHSLSGLWFFWNRKWRTDGPTLSKLPRNLLRTTRKITEKTQKNS